LFISILRGQQPNRHLFLETLDSIKLFLSKREYLARFKAIPDYVMLDDEYPDLTVSFLQVLAILSFEKENHDRLKSPAFLAKLTGEQGEKKNKDAKGGIFGKILLDFDQLMESKSKQKKAQGEDQPSSARFGGEGADKTNDENEIGGGAMQGNPNRSQIRGRGQLVLRRNRIRGNQDKNRAEELALAVSIILANLSCDREFLCILLGVKDWPKIQPKAENEQISNDG
jgi:hypothetical protein